MKRIPSLDGLRAIAILMVLVSHAVQTKGNDFNHLTSLGSFGVRIFFVISGLLITRLLINEEETLGTISLRNFYYRRSLRIFPAMWFYLFVIAAMNSAELIQLRPHDLLAALTYTVNYHQQRSWYMGHLWSLSVEEQFYLLWPFAVVMLKRAGATKVAVATVLISPLLRIAALMMWPDPYIGEWFPTICDAIAIGCLMALIPAQALDRLFTACRKPWFIVVPAFALIWNSLQYHADPRFWLLYASFGQTLINSSIALTIGWLVAFPDSLPGRILNSAVPVWIGTISYSLYMWQQPFLNRVVDNVFTSFPLNIIFSFIAAVFSYYLVETPVLRLRNRLRNKRSASFSPVRAHNSGVTPV